ncbi:hypothetical protein CBS101457_004733 [Exobasidium rhododendri]|nr:hypothetical protein CBS101457_004733 [Exobasidium rhododendri]
MDVLDLPTHQLILLDLASNLAEGASQNKLTEGDYASVFGIGSTSSKSSLLTASAARTQIALASFASSISSASSSTNHSTRDANDQHLVPVLNQLFAAATELPSINVEEELNLVDWPLPDQLAFACTTSLLRIADNAPQHRIQCVGHVISLAEKLISILGGAGQDAHMISTCTAPKFNGFYRAISSVSFPWSLEEFARLTTTISSFTASNPNLRRLNEALLILPEQQATLEQADRATRRKPKTATVRLRDDDDDARSDGSVDTFFSGDEEADDGGEEEDLQDKFIETDDEDAYNYRLAILAHYRQAGRPLSGFFVLCAIVESLGTILAQSLAVHARPLPAKNSNGRSEQASERRDSVSDSILDAQGETDTTRLAWKSLLQHAVRVQNSTALGDGVSGTSGFLSVLPALIGNGRKAAIGTTTTLAGITSAIHLAGRTFHNLQRFVESEGTKSGELFVDVYALEILSESLKLSALASVAQSQFSTSSVDGHTLVRIRSLLSDSAFVFEPLVQGAALQSTSLLVRNFPKLVMPMTTQLRRFATAPLSMFELTVGRAAVPSPVLALAARCLATCVTIQPGDDLAVSTIYTLLNNLGSQSGVGTHGAVAGNGIGGGGGAAGRALSVRSGISRAVVGRDFSSGGMTHSPSGAFHAKTEDQRRLVSVNTVAMVARLALEVGKKDVIALTISLLLQRLRSADEFTEAAILNNVVSLALVGPKQAFIDVIRAFSQSSRSATQGGTFHNTGAIVQGAQLRLASGLGRLKESDDYEEASKDVDGEEENVSDGGQMGRKEIYVVEILNLFAEKGMQLQSLSAAGRTASAEEAELKGDLQGLLPVLSTILSHADVNPQLVPTVETVSLFRSMWFLAVIFGLSTHQQKPTRRSTVGEGSPASNVIADALGIIAIKTPTLVPELANNYLESDLSFNSVLKRDYSSGALDGQRKVLSTLIPSHAREIHSLAFPQVTFLNTIYNLECMRSSMGMPSMILWYFVNEGLNTSALVGSMEAIADKVIGSYIEDLAGQTNDHALEPRVTSEVKNLLLGCCHRVEKVRNVSRRFLDRLITAYPSLLCDSEVVVCMLEMLTLLRQGCEGQYKDEYYPVYHFRSERANIEFDLTDSYPQRGEILTRFLERTRLYMKSLLGRAPVELQGILQRYLGTFDDAHLPLSTELGKSVAVEFARSLPSANSCVQDVFLPNLGGWNADVSSGFVNELTAKSTYLGEMTGIHLALTRGVVELQKDPSSAFSARSVESVQSQLEEIATGLNSTPVKTIPFSQLRRLLYRSAALAVALPEPNYDLLHYIVSIPIRIFTPSAISTASHVWNWIIGERPVVETKIMVEITLGWSTTVKERKGLFSQSHTSKHPLTQKTEMSPSDRIAITKERERATRQFMPHLTLVQLISSRFEAFRYRDPSMVLAIVRLLQRSAAAINTMSTHPLSREVRFALVLFGFKVIQSSRLDGLVEFQIRHALYQLAFDWFAVPPQWSYGSNRLQIAAEMQLLSQLLSLLHNDHMRAQFIITSFPPSMKAIRLPGHLDVANAAYLFNDRRTLLQLLLEDELSRFTVWNNPLQDNSRGKDFVGDLNRKMDDSKWTQMVRLAWKVEPRVAVQMVRRFKHASVRKEIGLLVRSQPYKVVGCSDALELLVEGHLSMALKEGTDLRWLLYWAAITPVEAILLFQSEFENHPFLLQYAMRTLEQHPVDLTFFYVPQVVQALRDDKYGYVEQFIFETSKISQLFCHQIIWNMKANSYRGDDAEEEDPMKPTLDRMTTSIVEALSGQAKDFYDREFGFFDAVTSISGKLKPYIKKSKAEKKAKIDEEMAKIEVKKGVYLPSNADGVVIDLARKSGRPLQSHAKAPFMATFKVHRDIEVDGDQDVSSGQNNAGDDDAIPLKENKVGRDVWQSAIFKVGDDCRQDVLILQSIAMLKNIWQGSGLDLYVYPYRVTATAPGCGVIDVVPNSTSRDEMGRAQVNNLNAFYLTRFGNVDSISYQQARLNFIKSMAGYSLACHLYQLRDRHGGNIMFDAEGHVVHIDFGFCFCIGPGGMKFEPYSFKFSLEFAELMGGKNSQGYKMFSELFVKGFLALRPYTEELIAASRLMYGTELPCFKGMETFDELRSRFVPHLDERQAAAHAVALVEDAYNNRRATAYDAIQKLQNGIPY